MSKVYLQDIELAKKADVPDISGKQDVLVSGTNIKTINNQSILGSGNIDMPIIVEYGVSPYDVAASAVFKPAMFKKDDHFYPASFGFDIRYNPMRISVVYLNMPNQFDWCTCDVNGEWEELTGFTNATSANLKTINNQSLLGSGNIDIEIDEATENTAGTIKLNTSQGITVDSNGKLTINGRLGVFPGSTGIYASNDRDPRAVGDSSFLITDAMGMSLDTNRAFALVSGLGITCKSAAAGTTEYHVSNTYANRLKCKICEGGYASIDEATSKTKRIVPVVSVTIDGRPYTPNSSANDSSKDIVITVEETLNPSSATTGIRLFGVMKSYSTVHVGNGVASLGGGRNLFVGGGITKVGNSNDDCAVGADIYISGNGNAAFGRWHIMAKNRGFAAGTGHDFTNAMGEGAAAVGQYSDLSSTTLLAVGNGTSHTARSNAFEVTSDGGIVLKSPNGTRYKITVDDSGNISTTAL